MPKKTNSVVKKSTVKFSDTNIIHESKTASKTSKPIKGGLKVKDDPDKVDKDDYDSNPEEEKDEEDDDGEEEAEEESEAESSEKEDFDREKDEDGDEGGEGDDDECVYKLTKKKNTVEVDIDVAEDNFEDEDLDVDDINKSEKKLLESKYVKENERKTKPFLFDFERVRILGERARQLSLGAKPMLKNLDNMNPKYVAKLELEKKVIPLIILRELPNGLIEKWKVSELNY